MKKQLKISKLIFEATALALILLFCYAATSKISDFQNFQIQLAQSPMLSAFAVPLSFAVPISELLLALLLMRDSTKIPAMYLSFTIMVMFTAYIFIILNYSAYVPCSCGGVLEKLGWEEHLLFNMLFVLLAAAAVLAYSPMLDHKSKSRMDHGY